MGDRRARERIGGILINTFEIYDRISVVSPVGFGRMNFGQVLLFVLAVVGVLFMIIQFVALVIGFVLARQITGAVHDLFTGTQHVRGGNFGHQIPVRARDQLGELAESFNLMTGEVTTLLGEMAEKGRLEQEMFAAREIQQKLLPTGPLKTPGLPSTRSANRRARWRGLLRLPADHRLDAGRADRRRRRQGPRRRPLHGAAEGDRAVAGAPASRAEGVPHPPSTRWCRRISTARASSP